MPENMKFRSSRNSGSLLASAIVLMVGFLGVTVVTVLAFPQNPWAPWGVAAGMLFVIMLFVWAFRDKPEATLRERFRWLSRKQDAVVPDYTPRRRRSRTDDDGPKRPPTLDEIRELKDTDRNWVPSNTRAARFTLRDD